MPASRPSDFTLTAPGALRIYDTDELLRMPPPTWLIQDVLPSGGLIGLYGPPGSGKTFVALDMALCVAAGREWQGKAVEPGYVVYVSAEGTAGLGKRIKAWIISAETPARGLQIGWVTEGLPIYAGSDDLDVLFARFEELDRHPTMVILDTMARCFEGDENLQKDMSSFVSGVDRFRRECGAAVLVVHHTNVDASRERGSTAFRGAADTMIRVTPGLLGGASLKHTPLRPPQGVFSIICDKQKDAEPFQVGLGRLVVVPDSASCSISIEWLTEDELP